MHTFHSPRATLAPLARKLLLIGTLLACAFALLAALATADARAAAVVQERPSEGPAGPLHLQKKIAPQAARGARETSYALGFRNSYGKTVNIAVTSYDPWACGGGLGDWQSKGWFVLAPGEEKTVVRTANPYVYFYAKAVDGTEWAGDNTPNYVMDNTAFTLCASYWFNDGRRSVGMREVSLQPGYSFRNIIP